VKLRPDAPIHLMMPAPLAGGYNDEYKVCLCRGFKYGDRKTTKRERATCPECRERLMTIMQAAASKDLTGEKP